MAKKKSKKINNDIGKMLNMGVTNLVGVSMIGATAGAVNALPAGTAKTVSGILPGLQSTSLVASNLKGFKF